ncbi:MAG: ABC transporter permease [Sphingomonas sp.]|nr:ABC transporter permease [Sphingomonas sp.]
MREMLRAAFVIARRDFSATVLSRTFLLFLLGPFFPVLMVGIFGAATAPIGASDRPTVAVLSTPGEFQQLIDARNRLQDTFGAIAMINLERVEPSQDPKQSERLLQSRKPPFAAIVEGGLSHPRMVGTVRPESGTAKQMRLFIAEARKSTGSGASVDLPVVMTSPSRARPSAAGTQTAHAGQALLFLLTLLLAGMLLSQLVEEKSNKVIEVLAAAVPIDAVFLGKLLAMLSASLVGIAVWASVAVGAVLVFAPHGLGAVPVPAVGWPIFILLGIVYFAMSYLLLGSIFLGIGGHASSAREVQTLSMPVTMAQVVIFAVASIAVGDPDSNRALAAAVFPLSSPYVMIARAAEVPGIWPHVAAVGWQLLWIVLLLNIVSRIFRKSVLKSGPVRSKGRKPARA